MIQDAAGDEGGMMARVRGRKGVFQSYMNAWVINQFSTRSCLKYGGKVS